MVDLDLDLDFPADGAEAAEFALLVVVVRGVELNQTKMPTLRIFAFINYAFLALTETVLCSLLGVFPDCF